MIDMNLSEAFAPIPTPDAGSDSDYTPPDLSNAAEWTRITLLDHAVSLDRIYVDMCDHAEQVFKESPEAAQGFLRLALRAQSGCRSSLLVVERTGRQARAAETGGEGGTEAEGRK